MENKYFFIILFFLLSNIIVAIEVEDINGTWVGYETLLITSRYLNDYFSWGIGKTIPNTSLDIDLGKKKVRLTGYGGYIIDSIHSDNKNSVFLKLISV